MARSTAASLKTALKTFEARGRVYGGTGKRHGAVMQGLFPDGIMLDSPKSHEQFILLSQIVVKLTRYTNNLRKPHKDSAHDIIVYAAMLEEID